MSSRWASAVALATGLFLLAWPQAAHAQDPVDLNGAYVLDTVGAISGDEARVQSALDALYGSSGIQLFVVFVDTFTLPNDPIAWADKSAQANGLGVDDVLLAVALDDRQYALSVADNFVLGEAQITNVERSIEAELRDDRWADAAIAGAVTLAIESATVGGATPGSPTEPTADNGGGIPILPIVGGVAVVGVGVFIFSRIRKRVGGSSVATPPDQLTQKQLNLRAGSLLVQLDDSLKTSEQELGFAVAQFGEAATSDFTAVLASAKSKVANAFTIRQKLDDHNPDSDADTRAWTVEIIQLCEAADAELDSQADAFDELRQLEKNAPEALKTVLADTSEVRDREPIAQATLAKLFTRYSAAALTALNDNVPQAKRLMTFAKTATDKAEAAISAGQTSAAAIAVRAAQSSVGQINQLFDAIDALEQDLAAATAKLTAAVTDTTNDIAAARALPADATLTPAIAIAEATVALAAKSQGDPLASLAQVETANAALDQVFASVRDMQAKVAAARAQLGASITAARTQISSTNEFISTRRGAIGESARTRVSEADRRLAQALTLAEPDPIAALVEAQRARELGVSALELATRDVASYSAAPASNSWPGSSGPDLGGLLGGLAEGLLGSGRGSRSTPRSTGGRATPSSSRSGSFGGSSRSAARSSGGRSSRGGRF